MNQGMHCRVAHILCCPCPEPCFYVSNSQSQNPPSIKISIAEQTVHSKRLDEDMGCTSQEGTQFHTKIYMYKNKGETKTWLAGKPKLCQVSLSKTIRSYKIF